MTIRLYSDDSYLAEFEAEVIQLEKIEGRAAVILDRTAFYPESGGQPADRGQIGSLEVIDVREVEGEILHFIRGGSPGRVGACPCRIDRHRRFDHMQQHTGQHILSQAFLRRAGAVTVSFHLGTDSSTIDLSVGSLDRQILYSVEDLANRVVYDNHLVQVRRIDSAEQDRLPIRRKSERTGTIRIVEIEDFDISPCGGTHCRRTGEVGIIKIRRWEKVRKQVRVEFFCGQRALEDYRRKNRILFEASRFFSVGEDDVMDAIRRSRESQKALAKQLEKQKELLLESQAADLVSEARKINGIVTIAHVFEQEDLRTLNKLASALLSKGGQIVLLAARRERPCLLFAREPALEGFDMNDWIRKYAPRIEGKGGGNALRAQAVGTQAATIDEVLQQVLKEIPA